MTTDKRLFIITMLAAIAVSGVFAGGSMEGNSMLSLVFTTGGASNAVTAYLPRQVAPAEAVKALFTAAGVDASYLDKDLTAIPHAVRDAIDEVYAGNKGTLDAIIYADLASRLTEGEVEYAYTVIGRLQWALEISRI
jgi:hypothetical protein